MALSRKLSVNLSIQHPLVTNHLPTLQCFPKKHKRLVRHDFVFRNPYGDVFINLCFTRNSSVMFEPFHSEGTIPSSGGKLNTFANGVLICSTISLCCFSGIPSTPVDLLSFIFLIFFSIISGVTCPKLSDSSPSNLITKTGSELICSVITRGAYYTRTFTVTTPPTTRQMNDTISSNGNHVGLCLNRKLPMHASAYDAYQSPDKCIHPQCIYLLNITDTAAVSGYVKIASPLVSSSNTVYFCNLLTTVDRS